MQFVFPYWHIKQGSKIVLYGAGMCGLEFFLQLHLNHYCEVAAWIDRSFDGGVLNPPFDCLNHIDNYDYEYIVIAIADFKTAMQVKKSLTEKGVSSEVIVWSAQYTLSTRFLPAHKQQLFDNFKFYIDLLDTYLKSGIEYGGEQFYQSFGKMGIRGSRPSLERIIRYNIPRFLSENSTVLDIGCNTGFLDLQSAPYCKKITGVDIVSGVVEVASKAARFMNIKNAEFVCKNVFAEGIRGKYDAIFLFAVHGAIENDDDFLKITESINDGGYLFFESHDISEDTERYERRCALLEKKGMSLKLNERQCDSGAERIVRVYQKTDEHTLSVKDSILTPKYEVKEYETLEELFASSEHLKQNVVESGLQDDLPRYIDYARSLIENNFQMGGGMCYRELSLGHRCTFLFHLCDSDEMYILGMPYLPKEEHIKYVSELKKELRINERLLIYDKDGYRIMRCGDTKVNFKDKSILEVAIAKLRNLHQNTDDVLKKDTFMNLRILEYRFREKMKKTGLDDIFPSVIYKWIDEEIMPIIMSVSPVLCHGDASYGNLIVYDGEVEWIDWELMCMSNPMFDLFYFYESLRGEGKTDKGIKEFLGMYYMHRQLSEEEMKNVVAMGAYFTFWRVCNELCAGITNDRLRDELAYMYLTAKEKGLLCLSNKFYC